ESPRHDVHKIDAAHTDERVADGTSGGPTAHEPRDDALPDHVDPDIRSCTRFVHEHLGLAEAIPDCPEIDLAISRHVRNAKCAIGSDRGREKPWNDRLVAPSRAFVSAGAWT